MGIILLPNTLTITPMKPKCNKEEIVLHRFGVLETKLTAINQCKDVGHHKYQYRISMYCQNQLDHNGYLIDNLVINKAIKESIGAMDSCERLCIHFADILEQVIVDHGVILDKLYVYIEPLVDGEPVKNHAAFELTREYELVGTRVQEAYDNVEKYIRS